MDIIKIQVMSNVQIDSRWTIDKTLIDSYIMSKTLADWFVIQVKIFSFFMITWITSSRPNRFDGHG